MPKHPLRNCPKSPRGFNFTDRTVTYPTQCEDKKKLSFHNHNLLNQVALTNCVENIEPIENLAEAGVNAVKVLRVLTVVANEELRAARVLACVSHREHAAVVVLAAAVGLAFNAVARTAGANTRVAQIARIGASALNHKIRNHAVKTQPVVEPFFCKFHKVINRVRNVVSVQFSLHNALFCVKFCCKCHNVVN